MTPLQKSGVFYLSLYLYNMKFLITENQILNLFAQFMKQYDWKVWEYSDDEITVHDGNTGKRVFYTTLYSEPTDEEESEYTLQINSEFFDNVLYQFFGEALSTWDLVKWFNNEFTTNCVSFDFFSLDNDEEEF
jgi:hypothetical protein